MKGVLLARCPGAAIVDITHEVPAHDVPHGAFVLEFASRTFPPDAVHIAVVDPGVGTDRRPLVVVTPDGTFVGPDNGLFGYVLDRFDYGAGSSGLRRPFEPVSGPVPDTCQAFVPDDPTLWAEPVSDTFHGRDVFAPVAAHLANGMSPGSLGHRVYEVLRLWVPGPVWRGALVHGMVVYVDRFGNLVSNIRAADLGAVEYVEVQGVRIEGMSRSYRESTGPLALVGSHGWVEVAVTEGSAADLAGASVGTEIVLRDSGAQAAHKLLPPAGED